MKKIYLFLFLSAISLFGSCTREQMEKPGETLGDIKLNITVANPGEYSKATKAAWEAGDRINIWFDANGAEQTVPDFTISYDGTSWNSGSFREGCTLKPEGYLMAVYESYNNLSSDNYSYSWESSREWFYPAPSKESTDYRCMPMVVSCENIPYTYTGNTLTTEITDWNFQTRFKVLVKNDNYGLVLSADSYVLQVHNITADTYPSVSHAWQVIPGVSCPAKGAGAGNAIGKAGGVQEADGIAFYYDSFVATSADILFTLSVYGDMEYEYAVAGKTLDASINRCSGVALKHSLFVTKGNIDWVGIQDWGLLN